MTDIVDEPVMVINGRLLTPGQAMAVRVAVASFEPDCGNDPHGAAMNKAYKERLQEVFRLMVGR